MFVKKFVKQ